MDGLVGLLKVRVVRGINLAYRDARGSDPYVVLRLGKKKLKTSVKKRSVNPIWHEELTLTVTDPSLALKLGHVQQGRPDGGRGDRRGAAGGGGEREPGGEPEERRHHPVGAAERHELPRRREPRVLEERQVRAGHDPPPQERGERGDSAAAAVGQHPSCCSQQVKEGRTGDTKQSHFHLL
ncbi:Pentatricopeptide repeat-containing protein ELI1 chloroplastic [Zea mays]|uniref:Pentatricopeptide repeat-containing protein ELI1 chloroplastic n=1 Tax=Zea mays TaxID=4577 RepID=A0A1D6HR71_MAIZE|nr:Pentatricopeptide repeat-containing protein ELI1 chloroplastic [Zea mays]